jgi:hypothetical protein
MCTFGKVTLLDVAMLTVLEVSGYCEPKNSDNYVQCKPLSARRPPKFAQFAHSVHMQLCLRLSYYSGLKQISLPGTLPWNAFNVVVVTELSRIGR